MSNSTVLPALLPPLPLVFQGRGIVMGAGAGPALIALEAISFFGDVDIVLHLVDDLFYHPFGVFHTIDQIIQVGRQNIANTLKNIWHTAAPSAQKLLIFSRTSGPL